MTGFLAALAAASMACIVTGWCCILFRRGSGLEWAWWAIGNMGTAIMNFLGHDWFWFAVSAAGAVVAAWLWYDRRRKRRDPAARTFGAKTKALRDALVRKAREAARPRPVLRPQRQGAGA